MRNTARAGAAVPFPGPIGVSFAGPAS